MSEKSKERKLQEALPKKPPQHFPGKSGKETGKKPQRQQEKLPRRQSPWDTDKTSRSQPDSKSQPGNQPHINIKDY